MNVNVGDSETHRLVGLHLGVCDKDGKPYMHYDIGAIATHALGALKVALSAFEQIVTGEKLVTSLDVGEFYASLSRCFEEINGFGIESHDDVESLRNGLDVAMDIILRARKAAKKPKPCR